MADESAHVKEAIELLEQCSGREVTDDDMRAAQRILVAQLRQQVERGTQRATEAMDAELGQALTPQGNSLGAAPPTPDPMRPGYEVEQQETRIVLEVVRTLSARLDGQSEAGRQTRHEAAQAATLKVATRSVWVAVASVLVALILGTARLVSSPAPVEVTVKNEEPETPAVLPVATTVPATTSAPEPSGGVTAEPAREPMPSAAPGPTGKPSSTSPAPATAKPVPSAEARPRSK